MPIDPHQLVNFIYNYFKVNTPPTPVLTGNLRDKGIFGPYTVSNAPYFVVGGDDAPYGVLLNNLPTIRGHYNRHYKWVENGVKDAIAMYGAIVVDANEV